MLAVGRQRDRRQSLALALEAPDELRGHVLRIGGAAAIAEHQQLAARLERRANRRRGRDHRFLHGIAHAAMQARSVSSNTA